MNGEEYTDQESSSQPKTQNKIHNNSQIINTHNIMKKTLLFALAVLLLHGMTSAQSKWSYTLGFGGEGKSGNVNSVTLNNNGGIERNDSLLSFSADYSIIYGQKDHVEYDRGFNANLKFDLWQYDRWSPFFSASYLNNKYKGYEYKNSFLLGVKYRIYTLPGVCDYSVSAAFVYDFVQYTVEEDALKPQVARISLRAKIKQKIADGLTLKHTTFYQPSVSDFSGDYIVTSITSLESKLTTHLFFDIAFNYEYRSLVPKGIEEQDIITTASLKLKF